jgi:hypothetical protein
MLRGAFAVCRSSTANTSRKQNIGLISCPSLQDLSHLPRWIRRKVAISVVQARMPYSGMPQQPKSSARILAETTFNLDPGCKLTGRCE